MDGAIQHLPWDTGTFGYRVGRARFPGLPPAGAVRGVAEEALRGRYRLVYCVWPGGAGDGGVEGLPFVSTQADFSLPLSGPAPGAAPTAAVSPCREPTDALLRLAFESGTLSRYRLDPAFRNGEFETLYRLWLAKGIQASPGGCFVAGSPERPDGFLTLEPSGDPGLLKIGLLAVDSRMRRRGVGRNLLAFAKDWAVGRGYRRIDVRTQECNAAAKALYSAAGFAPAGSESVGHLWLPDANG